MKIPAYVGHISFNHLVFLLHTQCHYEENLWNEDLSTTHTGLLLHTLQVCWTTAARSLSWGSLPQRCVVGKAVKYWLDESSGYIISWSTGLFPRMWTYAYRGQIWDSIKVGTVRTAEAKKSQTLLLGQGDISLFFELETTLLLLLLKQACSLSRSLVALANLEFGR